MGNRELRLVADERALWGTGSSGLWLMGMLYGESGAQACG